METSSQRIVEVPACASVSCTESMTSLGGRVRKTTQVFTFAQAKGNEADEFLPPVGTGTKVRDMAFVRHNVRDYLWVYMAQNLLLSLRVSFTAVLMDEVEALGKQQQEMIKQLYNIMFGRRFQQKNVKIIKEHILDFSGIIEDDEKSREHLVAKMSKWKLIFVHDVMDFLAIDRSKKSFDEEGRPLNKESLLERLIDWLYNPHETKLGEKKAVIAAKKAKQKANKRAKIVKKSESEPAKKKRRTTTKKAVAVEEDEDENDHEATESESSSDFDESKKTVSKKRKVTRRSKTSRIVESDNADDESENETNSSAGKDELQPSTSAENEANIADNDDPKPKAEVLDAGVCSKVRDIIAQGNAEELTVKKIVRQLSADLGRDMSAQKKAIKEFITNDQMKI